MEITESQIVEDDLSEVEFCFPSDYPFASPTVIYQKKRYYFFSLMSGVTLYRAWFLENGLMCRVLVHDPRVM